MSAILQHLGTCKCRLSLNRKRTLLPIIQQHVRPGTIVWSDEWAAYNRVQRLNSVAHQTMNHSITFVDPVTGVYTQNADPIGVELKPK